MSSDLCSTGLPLPKNWKQSIKSAVIHTLSLAFNLKERNPQRGTQSSGGLTTKVLKISSFASKG